jgi:hypothetical protein
MGGGTDRHELTVMRSFHIFIKQENFKTYDPELLFRLYVNQPLGKFRSEQKNNNEMYFKRVGWIGVDRTELAQDREKWWPLVNAVVPKNVGNSLTS